MTLLGWASDTMRRILVENRSEVVPRPSSNDDEHCGSQSVSIIDSRLRFELDAALREYDGIVYEIGAIVRRIEQNFVLYFTLVGALLATQLLEVLDELDASLARDPWILLCLAIVLLYFPVTNAILSADMRVLALYVDSVWVPRVQKICSLADLQDPEFAKWDGRRPEHERGPLAFTKFRAQHFLQTRSTQMVLFPLWMFRFLLLFIASALVLAKLWGLDGRLDLGQWGAWGYWAGGTVYLLVAANVLVAYTRVGNLPLAYQGLVEER